MGKTTELEDKYLLIVNLRLTLEEINNLTEEEIQMLVNKIKEK